MRVLVIGGANFIGPHVVAALDRLGVEITVYRRGIPVLLSTPRKTRCSADRSALQR
jgi:nucleoside-diphosphate-sugar epimerase